jgi:response regulator RpfG family c-di-GMP phosphodiesterase
LTAIACSRARADRVRTRCARLAPVVLRSSLRIPREEQAMPRAPLSRKMRILFVDDESPILSAIKRTLRGEPYELFFSNDPHEALSMIAPERIDIVVSDHLMPQMTGIELLSLVARLHPRVVRVVLTGQVDAHLAISAINAGRVNRFITKPWEEESLKDVLWTTGREIEIQERTRAETEIHVVR